MRLTDHPEMQKQQWQTPCGCVSNQPTRLISDHNTGSIVEKHTQPDFPARALRRSSASLADIVAPPPAIVRMLSRSRSYGTSQTRSQRAARALYRPTPFRAGIKFRGWRHWQEKSKVPLQPNIDGPDKFQGLTLSR